MSSDFKKTMSEQDEYKYKDAKGVSAHDAGSANVEAPQGTAIKMDEFMESRGAEIASSLLGTGDSEYSRGKHSNADKKEFTNTISDFHSLMFEPSIEFNENVTAEANKRKEWIAELQNSLEFRELHNRTMLDSFGAELSARKTYLTYMEEQEKSEGERKKTPKEIADEISDDLEQADDIGDALGGDGAGDEIGMGGKRSLTETIDLMRRIKNHDVLRGIFERAGAYRRAAQSMQRTRQVRGSDERAGIEVGGDLSKIVASERLRLVCGEEAIEDYAAYRLLKNAMTQKEYTSPEHIGRGPVVVVVDESGSMFGPEIMEAKAMTLALAWIARNQGRWFAAVAFNNREHGRWHIQRPDDSDSDEFMDWLESFMSGGTRSHVHEQDVPNRWEELMQDAGEGEAGKADIVTITDGLFSLRDIDGWNKWRAERNIKHTVIGVGCSIESGQICQIADDVFSVENLSVGADDKTVETVFQKI